MQDLVERLKSKGGGMEIYLNANSEIINEALEKEKEQIVDAYADGIDHDYTDLDIEFGIADSDRQNHAEQYYNQTYNQP